MDQATTLPEYIQVANAELTSKAGRGDKSLDQVGCRGPRPCKLHPCYPHSEHVSTQLTVGVGTDLSRLFTTCSLLLARVSNSGPHNSQASLLTTWLYALCVRVCGGGGGSFDTTQQCKTVNSKMMLTCACDPPIDSNVCGLREYHEHFQEEAKQQEGMTKINRYRAPRSHHLFPHTVTSQTGSQCVPACSRCVLYIHDC